jgi:glutamine amidotransferase
LENVNVPWMQNNTYVYFVNSFYAAPTDNNITTATSFYDGNFTAAVEYKNIRAVQFHPEKSGKVGIEILKKAIKC